MLVSEIMRNDPFLAVLRCSDDWPPWSIGTTFRDNFYIIIFQYRSGKIKLLENLVLLDHILNTDPTIEFLDTSKHSFILLVVLYDVGYYSNLWYIAIHGRVN